MNSLPHTKIHIVIMNQKHSFKQGFKNFWYTNLNKDHIWLQKYVFKG